MTKRKPKPKITNFKQICRYAQSHTTTALLNKAFEHYLEKNHIAVSEDDFSRKKAMRDAYLERAYVGKFKSQFVGGGRLEDSVADVKDNLDDYIHIYGILSDEQSRKTLFCYMYYYLFLDMDILNEAYDAKPQYYQPELLPKREHQVMADCGAYDGQTAVEFIETYGDYDRIYSYEPDPENYDTVRKALANYPNVTVFNRGVSDQSGEMRFTSHMPKTANRINPYGDKVVKISTLDDDIPEKLTFIKMDIESAEPNALLGAKRHIVEDKPDLAICVYHTISDIHTIPELICRMNPNQKFYLRHHGLNVAEETVLYVHPISE